MPYFYYYGFDMTYLILVLPFVILSIWASTNVNSTFKKYSSVHNRAGLTGAEVARRILYENGLYDVKIEQTHGHLTDHYDPRTNTVRLSESTYNSTSSSAIGVCAHEVGHAIQHAEQYGPIKIRTAIVPITQIGSTLSMPILLAGFILGFGVLIYVGIALFATSTVFQLVTLPTELNASSRALKALDSCGILEKDELKGAKKVLTAAALTYVAALASSLLTLLRYIMLAKRRDD